MIPPNQNSPTTMEPTSNNASITILQSSDGVYFRVSNCLLRSTSSILDDMLTIPTPAQQPSLDGIPIVHMTEVSTTLEVLLQLIHGDVKSLPVFQTLHHAELLLGAIQKYGVVETVRGRALKLVKEQFLERDPIAVYTVACRLEWQDLVDAAAHESLKIDLSTINRLDQLPKNLRAEDFQRLRDYHFDFNLSMLLDERMSSPYEISFQDQILVRDKYLKAFLKKGITSMA